MGAAAGTVATLFRAARSGPVSVDAPVGTPEPKAATAAPATEAVNQAVLAEGGDRTRCRPPDVRCRATERRTPSSMGEGCPNGHRAGTLTKRGAACKPRRR